MKNNEQASLSIIRILCVSLIFVFVFGISVMATNIKLETVKIILANKYETNFITTKTKVSDILSEANLFVLPDEQVVPGLDEQLDETRTIVITKATDTVTKIELSQNIEAKSTNEILEKYSSIIEKMVEEEVEIPFETITKDVSGSTDTINKVIKEGRNGLRKVTYRIRYQNEVEIERTEISSEIIREPVDKIIQIQNSYTTSRSLETARTNPALEAATTLAKKVEGITPKVTTLNMSAYTESTCDKTPDSPTYGITASGARVAAWYTVAAGSGYRLGTVMYIPYFKDKPNGGWFVVQDRGGAISNNKLDVYMSTYNECIAFGRRNLECYIYEF